MRNYQPPPKKTKTDREKAQKWQAYEKESGHRDYLKQWENEFTWLAKTDSGMVCKVCQSYEEVGSFVKLILSCCP